jgi:XapX domain-containing protein
MKMYLLSLGVGLLVGVIYALLNVRSPAPPIVALVGLLGILVGEQIPPLVKRVLAGHELSFSFLRQHHANHMFGQLPKCDTDVAPRKQADKPPTNEATPS